LVILLNFVFKLSVLGFIVVGGYIIYLKKFSKESENNKLLSSEDRHDSNLDTALTNQNLVTEDI